MAPHEAKLGGTPPQMKKVLSANATATLSVESIMEDVDVRGSMTRDQFEELCAPVLQRVRGPLQQVQPWL